MMMMMLSWHSVGLNVRVYREPNERKQLPLKKTNHEELPSTNAIRNVWSPIIGDQTHCNACRMNCITKAPTARPDGPDELDTTASYFLLRLAYEFLPQECARYTRLPTARCRGRLQRSQSAVTLTDAHFRRACQPATAKEVSTGVCICAFELANNADTMHNRWTRRNSRRRTATRFQTTCVSAISAEKKNSNSYETER